MNAAVIELPITDPSAAIKLVTSREEHAIYEGTLGRCVEFAASRGMAIARATGRVLGFVGGKAIHSQTVWSYDLEYQGPVSGYPDGGHAGSIHKDGDGTEDRWSMLVRRGVADADADADGVARMAREAACVGYATPPMGGNSGD